MFANTGVNVEPVTVSGTPVTVVPYEVVSPYSNVTAVEYGLLVALIAAVIVGVVGLLGTAVQGAFQDVLEAID